MNDRKKVIRFITSLVLISFTIFAFASLFTHSHNDPPFGDYPLNNPIKNCCGIVGAELSGYLFMGLGVTSFILILAIGTVGIIYLNKGKISHIWVKIIGMVLFIVCLTPIIYLLSNVLKLSYFKAEAAGLFGMFCARRLIDSFSVAGTVILLVTGIIISLVLITDSKLLTFFRWVFFKKKGNNSKPGLGIAKAAPTPINVSKPIPTKAKESKFAGIFSAFRNLQFPKINLPKINLPKINLKNFIPVLPKKSKQIKAETVDTLTPETLAPETTNEYVDDTMYNEVISEPIVESGVGFQDLNTIEEVDDIRAVEDDYDTVNHQDFDEDAVKVKSEIPETTAFAPPSRPIEVKLAREERPIPKQSFENYALPAIDLLENAAPIINSDNKDQLMERASILQITLKQFNVDVRVVEIEQGPVITMFELELAPGVKLAKIVALSDDLAIALKSPSVRVVAPLPKKSSIGLEVPNTHRRMVRFKEVIECSGTAINDQKIPLILGKDVGGEALISDMTAMPHLLIAGTTGSGKSVCLNTIILSVLCFRRPDEVKLLLVDPKMVEFSPYNDVPHLISPIVTDMRKAAAVLEWAVNKMEERYSLLSGVGVRNIDSYNSLGEKEIRKRLGIEDNADVDDIPFFIPFIIIIVDELADLMMVAAKEVESSVIRLSQKSRAVGIHLILATQRPSVNVVTGLIKSNMPSRISFYVASKIDSRTILDQNGADKLLGAGDMLFLPPGTSKLIRSQNAFVGDTEVRNVVDYLKSIAKPDYSPELQSWKGGAGKNHSEEDEHYDEAVRIVLESQRGSVSLVQRRLGIGYSRASRLIDLMADDGIIGEYKGSQAREVFLTVEDWENMKLPPL